MKITFYIFVLCFTLASCNLSRTNYVMEGDAMLPTIKEGEHLKIQKGADSLTYGDIVIFEFTDSGDFADISGSIVSRIVAQPGDKIFVAKDMCIINGKSNGYQFIQSTGYTNEYEERMPNSCTIRIYSDSRQPTMSNTDVSVIQVPKNHYFVMSDNRSNAIDSRYIGSIPKEKIIGKVNPK